MAGQPPGSGADCRRTGNRLHPVCDEREYPVLAWPSQYGHLHLVILLRYPVYGIPAADLLLGMAIYGWYAWTSKDEKGEELAITT